MGEEVILLSTWVSMYGIRVCVALAEKGIQYEYREENLGDKSPLLLEMNPVYNKIPVLIHNGNPVCESMLIVEYIDEVWRNDDEAPLLPSHPYHKAQAKFWADYIDKKLREATHTIWKNNGGEKLEEGVKEFMNCLKLLEEELGEKPYFGGDVFGFLDIALIGFAAWFYTVETIGNFRIETECPKLIAWTKRCIDNKESVSKSLPHPKELYDFVIPVRNRILADSLTS